MSALEDMLGLDFAPHSAEEDVRNLRELHETFRRIIEDRDVSIEQAMEKVRSLPGHSELKETIAYGYREFLANRIQLDFAVETTMDNILMEIADISPPLVELTPVDSDSDPEWSALYEDIDSDELAEMSTDEEDEEDRPPVARRLRF